MSRVVMHREINGPIKAEILANKQALELFSATERNDLIRTALVQAGNDWIAVFLPKRFTAYAYKLGYKVSSKTRTRKTTALPFVDTGEMRGLSSTARTTATAKGGGGTITIRIPQGHALRTEFAAVFRSTPAWEITRLSETVARVIAAELNDATYTASLPARASAAKRPTAKRSIFRAAATPPKPRRAAAAPARKAS